MTENYKVDNIDLKILEILMQDAKKPYTEVANKGRNVVTKLSIIFF